MNASSHLHNEAREELNAPVTRRRFIIQPINAAGLANPLAGHRDLQALIHHFDTAWRAAVRAKIITKRGALPTINQRPNCSGRCHARQCYGMRI